MQNSVIWFNIVFEAFSLPCVYTLCPPLWLLIYPFSCPTDCYPSFFTSLLPIFFCSFSLSRFSLSLFYFYGQLLWSFMHFLFICHLSLLCYFLILTLFLIVFSPDCTKAELCLRCALWAWLLYPDGREDTG